MIAYVVGNSFVNPVSWQFSTNYDNVVDHCIRDCLFFFNFDRSKLWYATCIQQLKSDVCTYLRNLDKHY